MNYSQFSTSDFEVHKGAVSALNETLMGLGLTLVDMDQRESLYWPMIPNMYCTQIAQLTDRVEFKIEANGRVIKVNLSKYLRDENGVGCWIDLKFYWALQGIFEPRLILGQPFFEQTSSVTFDFDSLQVGFESQDINEPTVSAWVYIFSIGGGLAGIALIWFIINRI